MDRMDYFVELYGSLPRGGPGDNASTRKAFEMLDGLPAEPRILDVGCGPGMQTIELLRVSGGTVVALDLLPQMITRVRKAAEDVGLADRLETVQADMNEMTFEPSSFDVIWSEGFFVFALQCMSTLAIMRRETNSWRWPAFAFSYLLALAYAASFATHRIVSAFTGSV